MHVWWSENKQLGDTENVYVSNSTWCNTILYTEWFKSPYFCCKLNSTRSHQNKCYIRNSQMNHVINKTTLDITGKTCRKYYKHNNVSYVMNKFKQLISQKTVLHTKNFQVWKISPFTILLYIYIISWPHLEITHYGYQKQIDVSHMSSYIIHNSKIFLVMHHVTHWARLLCM